MINGSASYSASTVIKLDFYCIYIRTAHDMCSSDGNIVSIAVVDYQSVRKFWSFTQQPIEMQNSNPTQYEYRSWIIGVGHQCKPTKK